MTEVNVLLDADGLRAELDLLCERRDEAIEFYLDQLREASAAVESIGFELDDLLAEYRFDLVKESVDQAAGYMASADDETLRELADIMSIELPGGESLTGSSEVGSSLRRPRMAAADLPPSSDFEKLSDLDHDEVTPALRDFVQRCADRIRYLLTYFSEDLWEYVIWAAECGNFKEAGAVAHEGEGVARELRDAYEYWIMWLNQLYCDSPSNFSDVGESTVGTIAWIHGQVRS